MAGIKTKLKNPYIRVILFIAGFTAAHFAILTFFYNYVQYKSNLRYKLEAEFEAKADTLDHLFIGSSHVNKGVAIDSFEKAFKFFGPSETAPYHYYRAKHLLENHEAPIRQIILPAEYGVLGFNEQPLQYMGVYWKKYFDFVELGMQTDYPFYYAGLGLKIQTFPYHQHLAALLIMRDLRKEKVVWRFFEKPSWADYSPLEKQVIITFLLDRHFSYGRLVTKAGKYYFQKLTELASEHDVQLVFLKYPLRPEYYNNITKVQPEVKRYDQWIDSLVNTTPNANLLDAMKIFDDQPDLYMDPHHLNERGKAVFSGWLSDTLDAIQQKKAVR